MKLGRKIATPGGKGTLLVLALIFGGLAVAVILRSAVVAVVALLAALALKVWFHKTLIHRREKASHRAA